MAAWPQDLFNGAFTMFARTQIFSAVFLLGLAPSVSFAAGTSPVGWVSKQSGKDDPGCGAVTSPCRTFQFAYDNAVAVGGTIAVRDAGGYGPLAINHSVSVINEGGVVAGIFGPPSAAIDIQAGATDVVVIKGLTLEGAGTGTSGIKVTSAGEVTVSKCTIKGFSDNLPAAVGTGVLISPASGTTTFTVTDSFIIGNSDSAIAVTPSSSASVKGVIKNVTISGGQHAIFLYAPNSAKQQLSIEDTVVTQSGDGVLGVGLSASISAVRLESRGNQYGVYASSGATITLSRSRAIQNANNDVLIGFDGSHVNSFGDNEIGTTNQSLGSITYK
jgi:hypothetical protein